MRIRIAAVCLSALCALSAPAPASQGGAAPKNAERFWPQWRGPLMTGVAPRAKPPVEWSETKNVRWRIEIPGKGSATPVIWGERIYVLTAVPGEKRAPAAPAKDAPADPAKEPAASGRGPRGTIPDAVQRFTVLAIDRSNGKVAWQRVVREELPHEGTHATGTWASASAATDGERCSRTSAPAASTPSMRRQGRLGTDLGDMNVKLGVRRGQLAGARG